MGESQLKMRSLGWKYEGGREGGQKNVFLECTGGRKLLFLSLQLIVNTRLGSLLISEHIHNSKEQVESNIQVNRKEKDAEALINRLTHTQALYLPEDLLLYLYMSHPLIF